MAALPEILIPHVPEAPEPVVDGALIADRMVAALDTESVSVPDVVIGEPVNVNPVEPPEAATEVTVPPAWLLAIVIEPLPGVMVMPDPAVNVALERPPVDVLPIRSCPSV